VKESKKNAEKVETWRSGQRNDFKNIFAEKNCEKMAFFDSKQS
jgi:hypothetical protein